MRTDHQEPTSHANAPRGEAAEARMAALILQINDEVSRAKMETFLHFARDPARLSVIVESTRDHGIRFVVSYAGPG